MLYTIFLLSIAGVNFSSMSENEFMEWGERQKYELVVPADPNSTYTIYAIDRKNRKSMKVLTDRSNIREQHYFESLEINCSNMTSRTVASGSTYNKFNASKPATNYTPIPRGSVKYSVAESVCRNRIKMLDSCFM